MNDIHGIPREMYLAFCPHCGTETTSCPAPNSHNFRSTVQCNKCNRPIDASKGSTRRLPMPIPKPKLDLLEIK